MKKVFAALLFSLLLLSAQAKQKGMRLIVRGDDMGYTHSGNEALVKSYKEGVETSIEVIKTYLFVDHPGINNEELQAVSHIGYEQAAAGRQGVTDVFTSEKVKAFIKQKGIRLISYKDLAPQQKSLPR